MFKLGLNEKKVLSFIFKKNISRVELIKKTGLTSGTITNITKKLINNGLCKVIAIDSTGGIGQPKKLLAPDGSQYAFVGIYYTPHSLTFTAIRLNGDLILKQDYHMDCKDPEIFLHGLEHLLSKFFQQISQQICAITILVSGFYENNVINLPSINLSKWNHFPIERITNILQSHNIPTYICNDVKACSMSEYLYGIKEDNFFQLGLLDGIGGAFFIHGKYCGHKEGVIGHLMPTSNRRPSIGDLQQYLASKNSPLVIRNYDKDSFTNLTTMDTKLINTWAKSNSKQLQTIMDTVNIFLNAKTIVISSYNNHIIKDFIIPNITFDKVSPNKYDIPLKFTCSSFEDTLPIASATPSILASFTNSMTEDAINEMQII